MTWHLKMPRVLGCALHCMCYPVFALGLPKSSGVLDNDGQSCGVCLVHAPWSSELTQQLFFAIFVFCLTK